MYYGHLHNHSNVSDGSGTPDDAYNYAKNVAGLDYFSTSNHVGYIVESEWASIKTAAEKYNEDSVFAAFWGFEWSGSGDVTIINTDDYTVCKGCLPTMYQNYEKEYVDGLLERNL